jgi:hypothetical protein
MSSIEQIAPVVVDGVVICGEVAASCACALPPGHGPDTPHACGRDGCGGQWRGTIDEDDFEIIAIPGGWS